jgi:hypothetical protein
MLSPPPGANPSPMDVVVNAFTACLILPATLVIILFDLSRLAAMAGELAEVPVRSAGEAFARLNRRLLTTLATEFLAWGLTLAVLLVAVVIGLSTTAAEWLPRDSMEAWVYDGGWLLVLAACLALLPVIVLATFAVPEALLAGRGVRDAYGAAWRLGKANWDRVLGYHLVLALPLAAQFWIWNWGLTENASAPITLLRAALTLLGLLWSLYGGAVMLLLWYRVRDEASGLSLEAIRAELVGGPGGDPSAGSA